MGPVTIDNVDVSAYTVPTDGPDGKESDGTFEWSSTTIIVVEVSAGGKSGLGYTYGNTVTAHLIESKLKECVVGKSAIAIGDCWQAQMAALRNLGRPGVGTMAVSAVDIALWDLKAKLLGLSVSSLLSPFHTGVPVYGSGGFCNYPVDRLREQVLGWVEEGIPRVKIKTSRNPADDPDRLAACRDAIGDRVELMTDANGALNRKDALYWAERFHGDWGVCWFEEPVPSLDREGLRLLRDRAPAGLDVAAGEYGYILRDFADLLNNESVDCLQADVTRCGGITGLLQVASLCSAAGVDLSAHCAPAISAHAFCAVPRLRHLEYFHDHVRIENMLFDGVQRPRQGVLYPDQSQPGLGLALKRKEAEPFLVWRKEG